MTDTLKLITKGRVTGLPHIVELRFCYYNGSFYVIPGNHKSDWVRNCLTSRSAKVKIGKYLYTVEAGPAKEEERNEAISAFIRKYGLSTYKRWYSQSSMVICLKMEGTPSRVSEIGGELGSRKSFLEWRTQGKNYYGEVAHAFDLASEEYDYTISRNFINTWIRRRSLEILRRYIEPDDVLIEIGCGTGAEAIKLCKYVDKIIATDISDKMIGLLRIKGEAMKLEKKIIPVRLTAASIERVRSFLPKGTARIAYSFNGALNCEPNMNSFVSGLASLIEPGGYFICSIRNNLCVSEAVSHAIAFQFNKLNPRKKQPTVVSVGGVDIPATYYSPRQFRDWFKKSFTLKEYIALPALLPPAYLNDYYIKIRRFVPILERLDSALADKILIRNFGDQTLFVFQRKLEDVLTR